MTTPPENKKVYLEIVAQLREMIKTDRLVPGDKIPSERELSERLQAGRSSVREALRALELLGLIETKRGEGTFIRDFRNHQLVQLLGTFILQDNEAKRDLLETKIFLELDSIRLVINRAEPSDLILFQQWVEAEKFTDGEFFEKILRLANNQLMLKIWVIIKEYIDTIQEDNRGCSKHVYLSLAKAIHDRNEDKACSIYSNKIANFLLS